MLGSNVRPFRVPKVLQVAHLCLSGALQFDYLSNGAGYRYFSRPLKRPVAAANEPISQPTQPRNRARRVQRHDLVQQYLADISTRPRLNSSEEYRLVCAMRNGDQCARQRLIEDQLGLVVVIARRYRNRGLPMLDLIAEGNLGLMTAISKFDPERGCRLSTYAKWWIRQSIELALMTQTGIVHVPIYVRRELQRRSRIGSGANGSSRTDSGDNDRSSTDRVDNGARAALENPARLLLYDVRNQPDLQRDTNGDRATQALDALIAPEDAQPEHSLHLRSRRACLEKALLALNKTEQLIIRARFGLDGGDTRTLDSLARQLGLSCERVRQIQGQALRKLQAVLGGERGAGRELLWH
jgi:RNA polymerase nonessential primary-like sigma factor